MPTTDALTLTDPEPLRLGELFCGAGGIAEGARQAGMTTAWATDRDADALATFRLHHPEARVVQEDVRQLDLAAFDGIPVDGIAFGFPCNDFSLVGERRGTDGEYGPLYAYGVAAVRRFRPKFLIAENVSGLAADPAFERILEEIAGSGYRLNAHLYDFSQYGVPQKRRRIVVVGIRDDLGLAYRVPDPAGWADADVTVAAALSGIPADAANHEMPKTSPTVRERLELTKPGENIWSAALPDRLRINVPEGGARISTIYRRLRGDQPAYTITAAGGGGTHGYHHDEPRALTNRERARLQSFPDRYRFEGVGTSVRRQIGMAVPPQGARAILEAVAKTLRGEAYPAVPASIREDAAV